MDKQTIRFVLWSCIGVVVFLLFSYWQVDNTLNIHDNSFSIDENINKGISSSNQNDNFVGKKNIS